MKQQLKSKTRTGTPTDEEVVVPDQVTPSVTETETEAVLDVIEATLAEEIITVDDLLETAATAKTERVAALSIRGWMNTSASARAWTSSGRVD